MRLLLELADASSLNIKRDKATTGPYCCNSRVRALLTMEVDQRSDVDVCDAIAVREAEVLIADVRQDTLQAPAGHRLLASLDERHAPRLARRPMHLHLAARQVKRDVARMQAVVGEVLLDHI